MFPGHLWLEGVKGMWMLPCPSLEANLWHRRPGTSSRLITGKSFPIAYFPYHIGPTASKLPFAIRTPENCFPGLVGVRGQRGGCSSSCSPFPALPEWVLRAAGGLREHLFSCLSRAGFLLLVLCLWPPRIIDGSHITLCRILPSFACLFTP